MTLEEAWAEVVTKYGDERKAAAKAAMLAVLEEAEALWLADYLSRHPGEPFAATVPGEYLALRARIEALA